MESESDRRYPSYGQYEDPRSSTEIGCMWCGKKAVSWQLSRQTCSHRCHAAIHLEAYKKIRVTGSVIPFLAAGLMILNILNPRDLLSNILLSFSIPLLLGFWIYSIWMVRSGKLMREKSPHFRN
jgi:hypothetical protein